MYASATQNIFDCSEEWTCSWQIAISDAHLYCISLMTRSFLFISILGASSKAAGFAMLKSQNLLFEKHHAVISRSVWLHSGHILNTSKLKAFILKNWLEDTSTEHYWNNPSNYSNFALWMGRNLWKKPLSCSLVSYSRNVYLENRLIA